ncbi:hypothetical protein VNI00_004186 [Paramarasmius palmivorus]|uniref:BTB domain-containing protein n=1 Tax=Paramarasmius palmivorus TaxID=297713 RepID=A0AAW0DND0_9AGAR
MSFQHIDPEYGPGASTEQIPGPGSAADTYLDGVNPFPAIPIPVSPTFGPTTGESQRPTADAILFSSDSVMFYVDEYTLLQFSNNNFRGLLPFLGQDAESRMLFLHDIHSSELEIALQALYKIPATIASTAGGGNLEELQLLARGISWLPTFGIFANVVVLPHTHIFDQILSYAPLHPLETYAIAGFHDLEQLAVDVSPHTLPLELSNVTEELGDQMGWKYMLRLFRLHMNRRTILMNLLAPPPEIHHPTRDCDYDDQKELKAKWNMAVGSLTWEIRADTPTSLIREIVEAYTGEITCKKCIKARDTRLNTILTEWSMSVRSI